MPTLILELILVFALAAFIGWLIGRFLCKSGEYYERKVKERILKENRLLKSEIQQQDSKLQEYQGDLKQSLKQITLLDQQKEGAESKVMALSQERSELLPYVQNLDTCEKRFNTLNEDFTLQNQQLQKEKAQVIRQADEIAALHKGKVEITKQLNSLVTVRNQLESQINVLKTEKNIAQQHLDQLSNEHQTLQDKYAELSKESLSYTDRILALNQEKESLRTERNEYLGRLRAISSVVDVVGTEQLEGASHNTD